jgi:hypothetical protein
MKAGAGSVDARLLGQAVHGTDVPDDAARSYEEALSLAAVPEMDRFLGARLLAPAVLWDVAEALASLPRTPPLLSVDDLAEALRGPLLQLERELDDATTASAYLSLQEAGVLDRAVGRRFPTTTEVVAAVVRDWATRLRAAGLLDPSHLVSRESFYRLVLPDRFQVQWREWVRSVLTSD